MTHANQTLTVYVGPMWAAKTNKMLQHLERFKYQHKRVVLFKPLDENRYSATEVVSHTGWRYPAVLVRSGNAIIEYLAREEHPSNVVGLDEAFMVPGSAEALVWLYRSGINVVVSTLDLSHACKPFPETQKLLPWATHVEKCSSVCAVCGADAFYTHKKQASDDEIEVGGNEMYEPRCTVHHVMFTNPEDA